MNFKQAGNTKNRVLKQDKELLCKLTKEGLHYFYPETGLNILKRDVRLPFRINDPSHVAIELTSKCNKGCSFCYASSSSDGDTSWDKTEVMRFCKNLIGKVFTINFGGGEPFEFDGVVEILNSLREDPVALSVTTNGLLLEKYLTQILPNPKLTISISLHKPEEISFVLCCIRFLRERGFKNSVNVILRRSKLQELREVIPELLSLTKITYLNFKPYGFAQGQDKETLGSEELLSFIKSLGINSAYLATCGKTPDEIKSVYTSCGAGKRWVTVTSRKTVKPCSFTTWELPLIDLTYSSFLMNVVPSCSIRCSDTAEQKKSSRINTWYSNNSSHSMDSSFWAIADDSIAKFSTGEDGALPNWPEANQEEIFEKILAESLNSKVKSIKMKNYLSSFKKESYWDYKIIISEFPLTNNSVGAILALSIPGVKLFKYGCYFTEQKIEGLKKLKGLQLFLAGSSEIIEGITYSYSAVSPVAVDKKAHKEGLIDDCGNEITYSLCESPVVNLKDIAPKLFNNLSRELTAISPEETISMAGEDYSGYYDECLPELAEEE
jgi:MoaA/NifB/PqqE/SkfB family radical SAM enzyme